MDEKYFGNKINNNKIVHEKCISFNFKNLNILKMKMHIQDHAF